MAAGLTLPTRWLVAAEPAAEAEAAPRRRIFGFRLSPAWPLASVLVGFPVWWALGLSGFVFPIVAVPMIWQLRRRRPIRLPRGFALWALFLVWVVISAGALHMRAPDTLAGSTSLRLVGYGLRLLNYLAQTVFLLYVGNLTERELPRLRVVRMMGVLFLYTVAGGVLGVLAPHFSFTSPVELLLPHSLRTNIAVVAFVHPASAQVQDVLGHIAPRPKAPFDYTNVWGGNLAVLAVFFVLGWWAWGSRRRRLAVAPILLIAVVPAVYSIDRGLWVGAGIAVLYVAFRQALRGRLAVLGAVLGAVVMTAVLIVASPLHTIISERLAHPHSNEIRNSLSVDAYKGALSSPIIGYGSSRSVVGSSASIAIGKTADCPGCGNAGIGSNGQFWLTLFAQGFVGVTLYTLFFVVMFWRSWRDRSPLGVAGTAVILVSLFFNFFYSGAGSSLTLYMIAIGLLWRNEQAARSGLPGSPAQPDAIPA